MIALRGVSVVFPGGVRALDGVDLRVPAGGVMGLVGESGSGKSTLLRVMMGLLRPAEGAVTMEDQDVQALLARDRLAFRRRAQMLLQDAAASLSPRMSVRRLLQEPIAIHRVPDGWAQMERLMQRLGLPPGLLDKYPHQISGGQARRIAVARALVLQPALVVADEPTAGLDVSVQGDLLNLLMEMQGAMGLTYLIASHNLNVVRRITGRVAVLYLGQVVEEAPTPALFADSAHPYAAALLSTNPSVDPARRRARIVLRGEIPSVRTPPPGCRFHTRCPQAQPLCLVDMPALVDHGGRSVRCHYPLGTLAAPAA